MAIDHIGRIAQNDLTCIVSKSVWGEGRGVATKGALILGQISIRLSVVCVKDTA